MKLGTIFIFYRNVVYLSENSSFPWLDNYYGDSDTTVVTEICIVSPVPPTGGGLFRLRLLTHSPRLLIRETNLAIGSFSPLQKMRKRRSENESTGFILSQDFEVSRTTDPSQQCLVVIVFKGIVLPANNNSTNLYQWESSPANESRAGPQDITTELSNVNNHLAN